MVVTSGEKKRKFLEALDKKLSVTRDQTTADGPYASLCPAVVNGPLGPFFQLNAGNETDNIAAVNSSLTNLLGVDSKLADTIETRLQETVMLLDSRVTQGGAAERARERARLSRSKRSRKALSLRQHRKLGSYDIPHNLEKRKLYQGLRELWVGYADGLVANCSETMMQSRLLTADLHGAILLVVECKNDNLIGLQGLMVRETESTFGLITSKDKFQVVPKAGTTFRFNVKNRIVTLFGSSLDLRGAAQTNQGRGTSHR